MDSISLNDIVKSFPQTSDDRDAILMDVEKSYRKIHSVLNYYTIMNPIHYISELKIGIIIRYSAKSSDLSCACKVINIVKSKDNKSIKKIRIVSVSKKEDSSIWDINPDLYYIFTYNRSSTKLRRRFYMSGITNAQDLMEDMGIKNNPANKSDFRENTDLDTKLNKMHEDNSMFLQRLNRNNLSFNKIIESDPRIADKIIKSDKHNNVRDHNKKNHNTKNHNTKNHDVKEYNIKNITSLLESDEDDDMDIDKDIDKEKYSILESEKSEKSDKSDSGTYTETETYTETDSYSDSHSHSYSQSQSQSQSDSDTDSYSDS